jgi:hypothetical protein
VVFIPFLSHFEAFLSFLPSPLFLWQFHLPFSNTFKLFVFSFTFCFIVNSQSYRILLHWRHSLPQQKSGWDAFANQSLFDSFCTLRTISEVFRNKYLKENGAVFQPGNSYHFVSVKRDWQRGASSPRRDPRR